MKVICCLLLLFSVLSKGYSQNYQSIFGAAKTKWHVAEYFIDINQADSFYYEKDTIVNGETWKKIKKGNGGSPHPGLIKEDLQSGKIWYKGLHIHSDTAVKLIVDYNLSVGDTFNINSTHKTFTLQEKTVDSVYFLNGKKHIVFKGIYAKPNLAPPDRVRFIEGTGCNLGPTYKDGNLFAQYLLCHYKDDLKVYTNTIDGLCWATGTSIQEIDNNSEISIFPNPFQTEIFIKNHRGKKLDRWELYSPTGVRMAFGVIEPNLKFPNLPYGIYYLVLAESNGRKYIKKLVKNK